MVILLILALLILVILYMTYPRYLRRKVSSARFFNDLPQPRKRRSRLRFGNIQTTLPFLLQLAMLGVLLAALLLSGKTVGKGDSSGMGVWFLVDTSASMSTLQKGEPRIDAAVEEVKQAVEQVQGAAQDKPVCFRLSFMDLERRDIVAEGDRTAILQSLRAIKPRVLGTDLGIVRRLLNLLKDQPDAQCNIGHLVVVTDIPAPGWINEADGTVVVWRDIGRPAPNTGFTGIRAVRNPLTGMVAEVRLEITAYGSAPDNASLKVTGPDGGDVNREEIKWQPGGIWQGGFTPSMPGQYQLELSPGGEYVYDDSAVLNIQQGRDILVDWQLPGSGMVQQMGWTRTGAAPHLRVTDNRNAAGDVPTLIVGPGYAGYSESGENRPTLVRDFVETSPLLADVNLDAVESIALRKAGSIPLSGDFQPVLRAMDGTLWLARAEEPLRAFVPGLPTGEDDVVGRFSATVFFNALRWLLQERELPPLYTLTSPIAPEPNPAAGHIALHKDEGNTQRVTRSVGDLEDLTPVTGKGATMPLWPLLLVAAAALFLLERLLSVYRY